MKREYTKLADAVERYNANIVRLYVNGDLVDEWDVGSPEYAEREEWYVVGDIKVFQEPKSGLLVMLIEELTQTFEGETQMNQILDVEVDVAITQIATMQTAHKKLKRREIPTFIENVKKSTGLKGEDLILVVADWESRKLEINRVD